MCARVCVCNIYIYIYIIYIYIYIYISVLCMSVQTTRHYVYVYMYILQFYVCMYRQLGIANQKSYKIMCEYMYICLHTVSLCVVYGQQREDMYVCMFACMYVSCMQPKTNKMEQNTIPIDALTHTHI